MVGFFSKDSSIDEMRELFAESFLKNVFNEIYQYISSKLLKYHLNNNSIIIWGRNFFEAYKRLN